MINQPNVSLKPSLNTKCLLTMIEHEDLLYNEDQCASFLVSLKFASAASIVSQTDKLGNSTTSEPNAKCVDSCSSSRSSSPSCMSTTSATEQDTEAADESKVVKAQKKNYAGACISPALPSDQHWLSEIHCYLRKNCIEIFAATEQDVASRRLGGGRATNIEVGQVGVRCRFCQGLPPQKRATQSSSFPTKLSGLSTSVAMMQCRHFPSCNMVPKDVRDTLASITSNPSMVGSSFSSTVDVTVPTTPRKYHMDEGETSSPSRLWNRGGSAGKHQYWISSAKKIGLVDTASGIRFERDPQDNCRKIRVEASSCSDSTQIEDSSSLATRDIISSATPNASAHIRTGKSSQNRKVRQVVEEESPSVNLPTRKDKAPSDDVPSCLVTEEDKKLIPDYLYIAMQQMIPCYLTEEDRVGCYKDRETGFRGIACRHCGGMPGFGKYFPATVRSLAQTTTSQTIVKHIGYKCKRCPSEIRAAMTTMQQQTRSGSIKNCNNSSKEIKCKPKYGSRKIFFQRVWGRLHNEHVPDIDHLQQEDGDDDDDDEEDAFSSADEYKGSKRKSKIANTMSSIGVRRNMRKRRRVSEVSDSDNEDAPCQYMYNRPSKFNNTRRRVSEDDITW
jgi:hypothetical protein